jgi:DNA-binding GntR family transcriptional regulator
MSQVKQNDPRPTYVQIADDLRAAIRAGSLAPGDQLKSARLLAEQYKVAQMTVWQAIRILRAEGLVVSAKGRGVFVADPTGEITSAEESLLTDQLDAVIDHLRVLEARVSALEADRPKRTPKR